jgi:phosphatidylglycerol:prolipoprotein diacylglycerol transferase
MIVYPDISPVAISLWKLKIRWYGLAYVIGFLACWLLMRLRAVRSAGAWRLQQVEELIFYGMLGVLLGGRIGYVLFYGLEQLLADPLYLLRITEGGMSFHGGLVGVLIAMALFARLQGKTFLAVTDFLAPAVPPGLFAGRIGNFINGELWGSETTLPWGFLVNGRVLHPSMLYEALLEGIVLFVLLWWYSAKPRGEGAVSGLFLVGYSTARILVEFVRTPDAHIGYLAFGWVTMGQVLSLPMLLAGVWLMWRAASVGVQAPPAGHPGKRAGKYGSRSRRDVRKSSGQAS